MTKPLIVIVGPTASGKTALSLDVAQQIGGEIICADSRTVYKGMDIGTAKPSMKERSTIPHHGLDLVSPSQKFTAADFQTYAKKRISEIRGRNRTPIMVGGTGLYVDSVIFNYHFGSSADPTVRSLLQNLTIEELQEYCSDNNIELPTNVSNKRHLIRAIELGGVNRKRNDSIIHNCYVVGISTDRNILRERIEKRTHNMFARGVVDETKEIARQYGWENEASTGSIYRIVRRLLAGEISESEAIELSIISDMQLAKRQMTWFKRNPFIHWDQSRRRLLQKCIQQAK